MSNRLGNFLYNHSRAISRGINILLFTAWFFMSINQVSEKGLTTSGSIISIIMTLIFGWLVFKDFD